LLWLVLRWPACRRVMWMRALTMEGMRGLRSRDMRGSIREGWRQLSKIKVILFSTLVFIRRIEVLITVDTFTFSIKV
jgi:hypothetical protein